MIINMEFVAKSDKKNPQIEPRIN